MARITSSNTLYVVGFQIKHPLVSFPDLYSSFHNVLGELHQIPQHAPEILATVEAILSDGSVVAIPRRLYVESTSRFEGVPQALDWLKGETVQTEPLKRMRYTGINFDAPLEQQAQRALVLRQDRLRPLEDCGPLTRQIEHWLGVSGQPRPHGAPQSAVGCD